MKFDSKSREELARESLTPPGEYDFEVMRAEETTSKKGNEMIKLKLRVFVQNGEIHVYDYLVSGMEYKLANFCDAIGRSQDYDAGSIEAESLVGACGKLRLIIEDAQKDPDTGETKYPPKNAVKTYISGKKGEKAMADRRAKPDTSLAVKAEDEEIPF